MKNVCILRQRLHGIGSVWNQYEIGTDIDTRDLVDPVWIGFAIWHQIGPLIKAIPYGTVSFQIRTGPV